MTDCGHLLVKFWVTRHSVALGTRSHQALGCTWHLVVLGTWSHQALGRTMLHQVALGTWLHQALHRTRHSMTYALCRLGPQLLGTRSPRKSGARHSVAPSFGIIWGRDQSSKFCMMSTRELVFWNSCLLYLVAAEQLLPGSEKQITCQCYNRLFL